MNLTIELVPQSCFFSNVRSCVSTSEWDKIRKIIYKIANNKCEICGGVGPRHPVECHEVWLYDDKKFVQKLGRMIALCPACHQCKHIGLAQIKGKFKECVEHLKKVNGTSDEETKAYISEQFKVWNRRSNHKWSLDLSYLDEMFIFYIVDALETKGRLE